MGERRRHLLGGVQDDEEGASGAGGEEGEVRCRSGRYRSGRYRSGRFRSRGGGGLPGGGSEGVRPTGVRCAGVRSAGAGRSPGRLLGRRTVLGVGRYGGGTFGALRGSPRHTPDPAGTGARAAARRHASGPGGTVGARHVCGPAGEATGLDGSGRLRQGSGGRVGEGGVGGVQVGAAQPEGRGGVGSACPAQGQGPQFRRAAGARVAHEAEHRAVACREGVQFGGDGWPFHRLERPGRAHGGRGQFQRPGEVQVCAPARHGRGVAFEQRREGAPRIGVGGRPQRHREAAGAVLRAQGGAQYGEHRPGGGVEDRPSAGFAALGEGVASVGADRQLHRGYPLRPAGRRVGRLRAPQYPRLPPAPRGQSYVGARVDRPALRHRQRPYPEPVRADEGQRQMGQGGHVGRLGEPGAPGAVQQHPGQAVDGLVTGDDRSAVVRDEPAAALPPGRIADFDEFRHGRTTPPQRPVLTTLGR